MCLPGWKNIILESKIFPAIFSVVNQKPGIEDIVSDKYIFLIDWKGKEEGL